ncbi:hypothetical protein Q9Q94_07770, partial [Uliginosibacterium sp. 31-16]|uniref:DUF6600 domain-containing protein n=1 Tax=Uliginosibacterium sp. 31-16 TaxID=3068315 RepID=UPI00273E1C5A
MSVHYLAKPGRLLLNGLLALSLLIALPLQAADDADEPSARVARLNHITGTVSFAPAETDDWVEAVLNRPLTSGDRLWVEKGGRAELHVGATAMRLAGGTGLEILQLNDEDLRLKLGQGSFSIRVRDYPEDEQIEISTPNVDFVLREPGEYRIDVNPDRDTTTVSVRRGAGRAYGADDSREPVLIEDGQRLRFDGKDLFVLETGRVGPRDEFEHWAAQRDDREEASASARYISRDMTGYEDLDAHGDWREVSGYGPVWTPRVTIVGWAPYHYGHWVWVAPWGWTWVDDAPWGFAPFHYGRWAHIDGRWGWVPGPLVRRPVYAPALVAFAGGSSGGVSWSISLSTGMAGVAWFALGPGEPYRPAYAHRPAYLERLNHHIDYRRPPATYANQRVPRAVAILPERDFVRGAPVRPGQTPAWHGDAGRLPVREFLPLKPGNDSRQGGQARREPPQDRVFRQPSIGEQRPPRTAQQRGEFRPGERQEWRNDARSRENRQQDQRREEQRRGDEQRQQAEQRRQEEPRRGEEQRRQMDQRQAEQRQQEQRREEQRRGDEQRQQAEQQRQQGEQRRQEEQRRGEEQRRQMEQRQA